MKHKSKSLNLLNVIKALQLEIGKPETTNHKRGKTRIIMNGKEIGLKFILYFTIYYPKMLIK